MGPKIQAAIDFVQKSAANGNPNAWAAIGDLRDAAKIMSKEEGTLIRLDDTLTAGVEWRPSKVADDKKMESKAQHKSG
jgi:carbamate kinase